MRKLIAMVLAMSMVFTMGVNAFASNVKAATSKETIYVELDNGEVIPIEVEETYIPNASTRSADPSPEVGSAYLYDFYVTNEEIEDMIGVNGVIMGAVGSVLTNDAVEAVAKLAQKAVSKKLQEFAANVVAGIASEVYENIAGRSLLGASNGYVIEVGFSYKRVYTNAAGNDVYAWAYSYTNVRRY